MGATGWSYFVPYQQNINTVLQELKDDVFVQGQYEQPFNLDQNEVESQLNFLSSVYQSLPDEIRKHTNQFLELGQASGKQQRLRQTPKNIKQLLEQCGTEGTHSILDIEKVSSILVFGAVAPLSNLQLMDIFNTEQPTHDMVEKWSTRIDPSDAEPLYECWEGIYIIVYKDSIPDEIYFEGCSGD